MNPTIINRREALSRLAVLLGGVLIGADAYLRGPPVEGKTTNPDFSTAELVLMDEIGDTIIPTTHTPGAKAIGIGAFMAKMVNDCYDDVHHAVFKSGLVQIDTAAKAKYGSTFIACTPAQRTDLLNELDQEQRLHHARKAKEDPEHYFRMLKQLTVIGYFTSEIGATKALRYVETPGSFDGSAPYKKGDRAWFTPSLYSL